MCAASGHVHAVAAVRSRYVCRRRLGSRAEVDAARRRSPANGRRGSDEATRSHGAPSPRSRRPLCTRSARGRRAEHAADSRADRRRRGLFGAAVDRRSGRHRSLSHCACRALRAGFGVGQDGEFRGGVSARAAGVCRAKRRTFAKHDSRHDPCRAQCRALIRWNAAVGRRRFVAARRTGRVGGLPQAR